jgi:tetratricopeptide (TPR) repeat protein
MSDQVIYTVGGTVQASGGIYISREADEELLRLCRAGEFCYVLTPRQMGKSSLMVATRERLAAEGIRSVEIDLTQMGTKLSGLTAERWYLGLIDLIVDQLDLDVDHMAWWDERARLGPTQRLSQFLRQVVLEQVSEPVVIFIDEIDSTLNLDFTDDFFAAIRACYNGRARDPVFKRLSFVLLGVATPSDLISDPQRTPFNIGRRIDLTDFTGDEAIPLADGLGLPPVEAGQVLTWILDWTGGHPYLTQRLCAAATTSPMKDWAAAAIDEVVEKTFFGEQSTRDSNLQFVRDMLTQRAPDKATVLKTYRRIHAGKAVPDEERSLVKTHLKLSGVVKRKEGNLTIRNRIYDQVFNQEWISQNMPRDWARRIAVISTILVLVLGGLFGYYRTYIQPQQTTEARAQAFIDNFRGTTSADVRITSLAGLFELSGYEDQARQLFYEELGPDEQRALFERADPQAVGTQLVTVVKGLYTELENNDQDNLLLEAMVQPLRELDDPMVVNLAAEIEQWIRGREAYAEGKYEPAVVAYSVAISLNDANPATHFDRAIAYASLGQYEEALADFEETLRLDERRALIVDKEIRSNGALYDTLTVNRALYPELVAVIPTPTPTFTFTPMPTPTSTFIPTPTDTLAPAPTPTDTRAATVTPTLADTATPTPTPTNTPALAVAGKIAFPVFDPTRKTYDVFIANADGAGREKIKEDASQPALSPDGKRIAFRSWDPLGRGLVVMNLDGSDRQRMTNALEDARPDWYPDWDGFVFHSRKEADRSPRLYKVGAWGGAEAEVLQWEGQSLLGDSPSFLGKDQIVYHLCLLEGCSVYIMNLDGSGNKVLVEKIGQGRGAPAGSPDGSRVAFMKRQDGNWDVYVVNADGSNLKRLTNDPAIDGIPTWSPDGRYIAFASNRGGQWAIWVVNPDGGTPQKLFDVGGSIDGIVRAEPVYSSVGWIEESISWRP